MLGRRPRVEEEQVRGSGSLSGASVFSLDVEWLRRLTGWWAAAKADGNRGHLRVNPDPRTRRRTGT